MLHMNIKSFFKLYKNKFFAISFAALALIAFLSYYGIELARSGVSYFTNQPLNIWNLVVVFIAYMVILVCNITNDSSAYNGILMFVFMIVAGQIFSSFDYIQAYIINMSSLNPIVITLTTFFMSLIIGEIVVGIFLYINAKRYRFGLSNDFGKLRLYGMLFAAFLTSANAFSIATTCVAVFGSATVFDLGYFFILILLPLSEIFMSISVCFTLERLRRL